MSTTSGSSFYSINLIIIALLTIGVGYYEHLQSNKRALTAAIGGKGAKEGDEIRNSGEERELKRFKVNYLVVYALAAGKLFFQVCIITKADLSYNRF